MMIDSSEAYTSGGGQTVIAKGDKALLADTGSGRNVAAGTYLAFGRADASLGEAEWAATQTVHPRGHENFG
jgi:hypothetical protein